MQFKAYFIATSMLFLWGCGGTRHPNEVPKPVGFESAEAERLNKAIGKVMVESAEVMNREGMFSAGPQIQVNDLITQTQGLLHKYRKQFLAAWESLEESIESLGGSNPQKAQEAQKTTEAAIKAKNSYEAGLSDPKKTDEAKQSQSSKPVDWANVLEELSNDPATLDLIVKVKSGFMGPEGTIFKNMLLKAMSSKRERDYFVKMLNCDKWAGGSEAWMLACAPGSSLWEGFWKYAPLVSETYLSQFSETTLKKNIKKLQDNIQKLTEQEDNFLQETLSKGDDWQPIFNLAIEIEPHLTKALSALVADLSKEDIKELLQITAGVLKGTKGEGARMTRMIDHMTPHMQELAIAALHYYTGKSWERLTDEDLKELIQKLSAFLKNSDGIVGHQLHELKKRARAD